LRRIEKFKEIIMKISKPELKQILESEIERHTKGIEEHKELAERTGSRRQREKMEKHFHKRFQTIYLAKLMGFVVCEGCGGLK
jgi:hypothetical protein